MQIKFYDIICKYNVWQNFLFEFNVICNSGSFRTKYRVKFCPKVGHQVNSQKMLVNSLEVIILARICSNLLIMLLLINFKRIIKTGSDCVKSRSLGQLTQKACKHYRNHIFNPNRIILTQNVSPDQIQDMYENQVKWFQKQVTRSNHRKSL